MSEPAREPVLRFAGAQIAFRLEAVLGGDPGFAPEGLIGLEVELRSEFLGLVRGTVRSVEPYVDPMLGPGHWVVLS